VFPGKGNSSAGLRERWELSNEGGGEKREFGGKGEKKGNIKGPGKVEKKKNEGTNQTSKKAGTHVVIRKVFSTTQGTKERKFGPATLSGRTLQRALLRKGQSLLPRLRGLIFRGTNQPEANYLLGKNLSLNASNESPKPFLKAG